MRSLRYISQIFFLRLVITQQAEHGQGGEDWNIAFEKSNIKKCGSDIDWTNDLIMEEFSAALSTIRRAKLIHDPFLHMEINGLFSTCFYSDLMKYFPQETEYTPNSYAGTDPYYDAIFIDKCLHSNSSQHLQISGRKPCIVPDEINVCKDSTVNRCPTQKRILLHDPTSTRGKTMFNKQVKDKYPLWFQMFRFVHSKNFTETLYQKLSRSNGVGIPLWKQRHLKKEKQSLRNSAAMRIESVHYHLTPHIDVVRALNLSISIRIINEFILRLRILFHVYHIITLNHLFYL